MKATVFLVSNTFPHTPCHPVRYYIGHIVMIYRHNLGDCGSSKLYLSVYLSVCPALTAYILFTMGRILMKKINLKLRSDSLKSVQ